MLFEYFRASAKFMARLLSPEQEQAHLEVCCALKEVPQFSKLFAKVFIGDQSIQSLIHYSLVGDFNSLNATPTIHLFLSKNKAF